MEDKNLRVEVKLDHCCNVGCTATHIVSQKEHGKAGNVGFQQYYGGTVFSVTETDEPIGTTYSHVPRQER